MIIFTPNTVIASADMNLNNSDLINDVCVMTVNGPSTYTTGASQILFGSQELATGVITGSAAGDTITTTRSCLVRIDCNLSVHSGTTSDVHYFKVAVNGGAAYTIDSITTAAGTFYRQMRFTAYMNIVAGSSYAFAIHANGSSGTHTLDTGGMAVNRLILTVVK